MYYDRYLTVSGGLFYLRPLSIAQVTKGLPLTARR